MAQLAYEEDAGSARVAQVASEEDPGSAIVAQASEDDAESATVAQVASGGDAGSANVARVAQAASEDDVESANVARVVALAGVSQSTFYDLFDDFGDCMRALRDDVIARASQRMVAAYRAESQWVDRVRAGLLALLELLDEEPQRAQLLVAQTMAGEARTLARRRELLTALARVVDEGRGEARAGREPSPLAGEDVVGAAVGVVHARLIGSTPRPLTELLNPLMAIVVLPYLGGAAALTEMSRPSPGSTTATRGRHGEVNALAGLRMRLTYRTQRALAAIAAQPGLSNVEVGQRAGISDQGQISKLLSRLARLEVIENTGEGQVRGAANAWRLTSRGEQVERAIRPAAAGGKR
jgi:AcrR family transcriptional regulator